MNTGEVSIRYARALLKYVHETGRGEAVYAQVKRLLKDPHGFGEPLEKDLSDFVALLIRNRRTDYIKFILNSFVSLYDSDTSRCEASLVTTVPDAGLGERIRSYFLEKEGVRLEMEESVDPELIGGFVLDVDGRRMDTSVRRQLEELRKAFKEYNRRRIL